MRGRSILGFAAGPILGLLLLALVGGPAPAAEPDAKKPDAKKADAKKAEGGVEGEMEAYLEKTSGSSSSPKRMQDIVVTAERGVPLTYPGGRTTIEQEELDDDPGENLVDMLRRVPGVFAASSETGGDTEPHIAIRGFNPRRTATTTILVDGVPITPAPYGDTLHGIFPITMERVARIDVIRGGGATRFGPNTIGGMINLYTTPIPEAPSIRTSFRYGSGDDKATVISGGGTWDDLGIGLTTVHKTGHGFREHADYDIWDVGAKFRFRLDDRSEVGVSFHEYAEDSDHPAGLTQALYDDDPDQSIRHRDGMDGGQWGVTVDYTRELGPTGKLGVLLYYYETSRTFKQARPGQPPFTQYRETNSEDEVRAIEARYGWSSELFGAEHDFFVSARVLQEVYQTFYFNTPYAGGARDVYEDSRDDTTAYSLFAEGTFHLSDEFAFAVGARGEAIRMTADTRLTGETDRTNFEVLLPSASLTWQPCPQYAAFVGYQESFRAPPFSRIVQRDQGGLSEERGKTFELGVRTNDLLGFHASLTGYYLRYLDEIALAPDSQGVIHAINQDETIHKGIELQVAGDLSAISEDLDCITVYANLTAQKSTIETGENEGNDVQNSPHLLAAWGIRYDHETGFWAAIDGVHVGDSYSHPSNQSEGSADGLIGKQPSYTTWDAAIGWRESADGTGFDVKLGVTNVFDEDYFQRWLFGIYPAAGRRWFATVGYTLRF